MSDSRWKVADSTGGGARPVLDPSLPPRLAGRLRKHLPFLRSKRAWARQPRFPNRTRMAAAGTAVAALSLLWALVSGPLLVWSVPLYFLGLLVQAAVVGAAGLAVTRVRPRSLLPRWLSRTSRRRSWQAFSLAFVPATLTSWFLALAGPEWAFNLYWFVPGAVYAAAALWAGWWWPRGDRLAAAHADRYLVPANLGRQGARLLLDVQRTIGTVEEADLRLGDSFDAAQPLSVLRAEEWRIASLLHRHERIREEYVADSLDAVSGRVLAVLDQQHERHEAVYRELAARVDAIRDYGASVEEALAAHTEWEQVQRVEERQRELDLLLVQVDSDGGNADQLYGEALNARAVRETRDELIDRMLEAGRSLEAGAVVPVESAVLTAAAVPTEPAEGARA
ncbi:hypothetical protein [Nocardiopsis dassonvillei]|uniref:hypothetical protein n=1 Tax=Nocardiopsis dassonvillei TaxID=2014 RepID=UPI00157D7CE3|nr:hypothetical protein [Nocardiopsis dassonvillei]